MVSMIDPLFYIRLNEKITFSDLKDLLSDNLIKIDNVKNDEFVNFTTLENASKEDISFVHNPKYLPALKICKAGLVLISEDLYELLDEKKGSFLVCKDVYNCCSILLNYFYSYQESSSLYCNVLHPEAQVSSSAVIGKNCYIGNATIGNNTIIKPNTVIADGVSIGDNVVVESNCSISYAKIFDNCHIASGCRIGSEGFGFSVGKNGPERIKHFGRVIINQNVSIGDNTVIHRGSLKDTVIGSGTKIDALVHIAHNVEIGENCFIAAQTGFAGSGKVKNFVSFGGQCGVAGHITIGSNVRFAAKSGVTKNIKDNSGDYYGMPAMPKRLWQKTQIMLRKITVKN